MVKESKSPKAALPGRRVYLHLSTVKASNADGSKFNFDQNNWAIIVYKSTGKKWSDCMPTKKGLIEGLANSCTK